jgi:preprotein translocase subunit SecG
MEHVILIIHLFLALAIIGLVLLQRSEGGGLGIGGGGLGGLASPKGTANALTRATAICAGLFFCTSLLLGIYAGTHTQSKDSILDVMQDVAVEQTIPEPDAKDLKSPVKTPDPAPEAPKAPIAQ